MKNKGFVKFMWDPLVETAWHTGAVVVGLNIRPKDNFVTVIVKAYKTPSKPMVAFITAPTYEEAMEMLYIAVTGDKVTLKWKADKFAKGIVDNSRGT